MSKKNKSTIPDATPDATPVFIHFFGTIAEDGLRRINDGNIGMGNNVLVNIELAATIHRTRESAEQCRRKTGGVIVPTTVGLLPTIFPKKSGAIIDLQSEKETQQFFVRAFRQEYINAPLVLDSIIHEDEGDRISDSDEDAWVGKISTVINLW